MKLQTFIQHLIAAIGGTIKQLIAGIATVATGACFFILYHGVCLGAEWLFDIPVTFDQRFLIEEIGYWFFLLGSVVGGVVTWKVFPPIGS